MITRELIRSEKAFYEDLLEDYQMHLAVLPKSNIFFKYQHGKWRPYVRRSGTNCYLSIRKNKREIGEMLEKQLIESSIIRIKDKIELLEDFEDRFVEHDEIIPATMGRLLENSKGKCFRVNDYLKSDGYVGRSFDKADQINEWIENTGQQNPYMLEKCIHTTLGGVKVRSKSELLIGTFLEMKEIPYKYEELLIVEGNHWYPDFKLLRLRDGKEIIWEHLGMMDNEEYAEKNQYKLMVYGRNGYRLGDNLIVTYDQQGSLDVTALDRIYEIMLK